MVARCPQPRHLHAGRSPQASSSETAHWQRPTRDRYSARHGKVCRQTNGRIQKRKRKYLYRTPNHRKLLHRKQLSVPSPNQKEAGLAKKTYRITNYTGRSPYLPCFDSPSRHPLIFFGSIGTGSMSCPSNIYMLFSFGLI